MSRSEFDIIKNFFANCPAAFPSEHVKLGIGDDAAQFTLPHSSDELRFNVSMDTLAADVHFPADANPGLIANRALAVNLSDLAAMGATPLGFTLGLTLPRSDDLWLQQFADGLTALATKHHCPLVGGNLSRGPLHIAVQVHGSTQGEGIRRNGAAVGDIVVVSGVLGDAVAALASFALPTHLDTLLEFDIGSLNDVDRAYLQRAYYEPEPRVELGQACAGRVSAGIDVSDGLLADLGHICAASGVGAVLELQRLPISSVLNNMLATEKARLAALLGGDDYELCFTLAPDRLAEAQAIASELGVPLTQVGVIEQGSGVRCTGEDGETVAIPQSAYQHFQQE
jgi:thiamine-monophosphate kinase